MIEIRSVQKQKIHSRGFTVAELLIVVAIIAVLTAIAIPVFNKQLEKSREAYDIYIMRQAASAAVDLYYKGITDEKSAKAAGLNWWDGGKPTAAYANAWGAYGPSGAFYNTKNAVEAYGKGTAIDGGTRFKIGNGPGKTSYLATEDYTDGIVMVSIYPNGNNKHVAVYWKNRNKNDSYIGNAQGTSNPIYCIWIPLE